MKPQIFVLVFLALFFIVAPAFAAAPDGMGPWADSVFSSTQGLMKNGLPVPAARSDPTASLGVAENDTVDTNFFSLGFGGTITLGFDNGISSGVILVEATNPNYPGERAAIEVSEDGVTWASAGTVTQDGQVDVPEAVSCAKFVRITDISDPEIMPDDIADGYDVDGVQAVGDLCNPQPTPTPTATPSATPTPTPTNPPSTTTTTTTTTTSTPGFPNTGGQPCTSNGVTTVPQILSATRVSPTSIFVSWGPNAGLNNFIVQYGFQNGNWQFSTSVSGFSTTIGSLPANQSIWVRVAATDNCVTGAYGASVPTGNTGGSPGFPDTGNPLIPGFPNTGFGTGYTNIFWSLQAGINFISTTFTKAMRIFNL